MPDAPIIERQRLRFTGNILEFDTSITNVITSQAIKAWCGKAAQIEIAHYYGTTLAAISNFDFVTVCIKAGSSSKIPAPTDPVLAQDIVAAAAFDTTVTDADWKAGTKQHFLFNFSDEEMGQAPGTYWIEVYATTISGNTVPLRAGQITFVESGGPSVTTPDPVAQNAWPKDEADARFVRLSSNPAFAHKVTWDGTYGMAGSPGDYDHTTEYLALYTGDGTTHTWLKLNGSNA